MSTDNAIRREAEQFYTNEMAAHPHGGISQLLNVLGDKSAGTPGSAMLRSFSGVLLRQAIEKYSAKVPAESLGQLRGWMLQLWAAESDSLILKRLTHALAQSAAKVAWPELIPNLLAQVATMAPSNVQTFLSLVEKIAEYRPEDIQAAINQLGGFLAKALSSPEPTVAVAAAKATIASILAIEDENVRANFRAALPPILTVLGAALSRSDELDATAIMELLVDLAQVHPIFFKGGLDALVQAMLSVAAAEGLEFSTRNMALELMVTLAEAAPAMARRCAGLVQGLVPLAMSLMLEIEEEDADWAQGRYTPQTMDDDEHNYLVGEDAIERAAAGMGGRVLSPIIFQAAQDWIQSPEWRRRRAAVVSVVRLAEGSVEVFKSHLPNALNYLETALADASPRVQYEAVQAVGQFSHLFTDASAQIVGRFLPLLTRGLKTMGMCARVRGHCAAAMINMMNPDSCEAETLAPHMNALLEALLTALQSAPVEVQSPCLVTLGFVAQVAEDAFVPYYSSFMPGIKSILTAAAGEGMEELRGKAMECAGLIGEAVGEEVFAADAMEVMQLLIGAMNGSELSKGDVVFDSILPACASVANALRDRFVQFLPFVMPPLIEGTSQKIDFAMEDATEEEAQAEAEHDEETGMDSAVINFGGMYKRVTLNTHAVQQKTKAASLLFEYAAALKGNMGQFLEPSLHALAPCITDKHSPELRGYASLGLARLFEACIDSSRKGRMPSPQVHKIMEEVLSRLSGALAGENNEEARSSAAEAFRDILQACFESGEQAADGTRDTSLLLCKPSLESSISGSTRLLSLAAEAVTRRADKEREFASSEVLEDEDRGAFEEEIEAEETLLSNVVDAIGLYVKLHGEAFMPHFTTALAPALLPYLAPTQPKSLQIVAICIMDDVIEFGGKGMENYLQQCMPLFMENLRSEDNIIRQSSSYGIAQMCKKVPAFVAGHMSHVLSGLLALVQAPTARDADILGITENALFGLGCLLSSKDPSLLNPSVWSQGVNRAQVGETWLRGLPLTADETEAKAAHHQLCDFVDAMDTAVVGDEMSRLKEVTRVLAEVMSAHRTREMNNSRNKDDDTELVTPITAQRILQLAGQIRSMVPPDVFAAQSAFLSDAQKSALQWV